MWTMSKWWGAEDAEMSQEHENAEMKVPLAETLEPSGIPFLKSIWLILEGRVTYRVCVL